MDSLKTRPDFFDLLPDEVVVQRYGSDLIMWDDEKVIGKHGYCDLNRQYSIEWTYTCWILWRHFTDALDWQLEPIAVGSRVCDLVTTIQYLTNE